MPTIGITNKNHANCLFEYDLRLAVMVPTERFAQIVYHRAVFTRRVKQYQQTKMI